MLVFTNSIPNTCLSLSIKDLIWIRAAYYVKEKMNYDEKLEHILCLTDMRALIKDIDDVQRVKSSGKTNAALKFSDLPSQQFKKKQDHSKVIQEHSDNDSRKKMLLCELNKLYSSKNK